MQRPDWRTVRDLSLIVLVLVVLWVIILFATAEIAHLLIDALTKFKHGWNGT